MTRGNEVKAVSSTTPPNTIQKHTLEGMMKVANTKAYRRTSFMAYPMMTMNGPREVSALAYFRDLIQMRIIAKQEILNGTIWTTTG